MSIQEVPFLDVLRDASGGNIKTLKKDFLQEGEIPVVDQGQKLVAGFVNDRSRICNVKPPVIVFGDHTRAIKYVDFEFAMGADGTKVLVPKVDSDTKYLYYALNSIEIPAAGYSRHYKYLKEVQIPLPPLAEQKRIAGILDAADALRAKRRESLAQLDTLLQSAFFDMFGDPLNHHGVENMVSFREVTSRITYGFTCPMEHVADGVPIITAKNVRQGSIDFENCHFATHAQFEDLTDKSKPEAGDLLITKDGAIRGRCALVKTGPQFCISQAVALIRPDRSFVVPEYLWGYIANYRVQRKIMEMDKGVAMPHLQITELAKFPIALPPLALQHQFAAIVKSVEQQRASQRAHLDELDTIFNSLQSRGLRGDL